MQGGVEAEFNGCEVTLRCDGQINGTIPFLFAPVFDLTAASIQVTARAVFDTRVSGITPSGALTPFVIHEDQYYDQMLNGPDDYTADGPAAGPGKDLPKTTPRHRPAA